MTILADKVHHRCVSRVCVLQLLSWGMRMPNSSGSDFENDRRPTFDGPKISRPIRYSERWHHAWLVQLSLDTRIIGISYLDAGWSKLQGSLSLTLSFAIGDHQRALGVRANCDQAVQAQGEGWEIYLREDIRRSVRSSNALAVWAYRDIRLDLAKRMALLSAIERRSGTSRFADLLDDVESDPATLATILGRLRCDGLIDFDLARVLSLDTSVSVVRVSSRARHQGVVTEGESVDKNHVGRRQSKPP